MSHIQPAAPEADIGRDRPSTNIATQPASLCADGGCNRVTGIRIRLFPLSKSLKASSYSSWGSHLSLPGILLGRGQLFLSFRHLHFRKRKPNSTSSRDQRSGRQGRKRRGRAGKGMGEKDEGDRVNPTEVHRVASVEQRTNYDIVLVRTNCRSSSQQRSRLLN